MALSARMIAVLVGANVISDGGASPGYLLLRGKLVGGYYSTLNGLKSDTSRTNLQGKAA